MNKNPQEFIQKKNPNKLEKGKHFSKMSKILFSEKEKLSKNFNSTDYFPKNSKDNSDYGQINKEKDLKKKKILITVDKRQLENMKNGSLKKKSLTTFSKNDNSLEKKRKNKLITSLENQKIIKEEDANYEENELNKNDNELSFNEYELELNEFNNDFAINLPDSKIPFNSNKIFNKNERKISSNPDEDFIVKNKDTG